nr:MAG TPA: Major head protein [Caudoviricetes sp.]
MEKKELLKMNLQHFAESAPEPPKDEPKPPAQEPSKDQPSDNPGSGSDEPQPSLEEQLQQMRIEYAKLKKAQEDAAADASNWKKKYNATLSDAEKLAQEKADKEAEKDAELARLRKESAVSKFEKNFLTLGYSQELAKKAAEAQFDGDTDTLFLVQSQAQEAIVKAKEAEWYKNRPEINTGADTGTDEDPFLKGFNSVGNYKK